MRFNDTALLQPTVLAAIQFIDNLPFSPIYSNFRISELFSHQILFQRYQRALKVGAEANRQSFIVAVATTRQDSAANRYSK